MSPPEGPAAPARDLPRARELRALLLDAGNCLVFLQTEAIAEVAAQHGVAVDGARLRAVEGAAKRRYERALAGGASHERGWGRYLTTLLEQAGIEPAVAEGLLGPLREEHDRLNLWRRVPDGLSEALARAKALGLRLGVVSNSEGRLPALFEAVGLARGADGAPTFEVIVDSAHEGIRKPDPRMFHRALERMGLRPDEALYAGDLPTVDVDGARRAGLAAALIDPQGFYPDRRPRFASVAALVDALAG